MSFIGDLLPSGNSFSQMFASSGPLSNSILGNAWDKKPYTKAGAIDQPPQKPPNPDTPGRTTMLGGGSSATY